MARAGITKFVTAAKFPLPHLPHAFAGPQSRCVNKRVASISYEQGRSRGHVAVPQLVVDLPHAPMHALAPRGRGFTVDITLEAPQLGAQ